MAAAMKTRTVTMLAGRAWIEEPRTKAPRTARERAISFPEPKSRSAAMANSAVVAGSEKSHPEYTNKGVEKPRSKLHVKAERSPFPSLRKSRKEAATANAE